MSNDIKFYNSSILHRVIVFSVNAFLVLFYAGLPTLLYISKDILMLLFVPFFLSIFVTLFFCVLSTFKDAFSGYGVDEAGLIVRFFGREKRYSWDEFKDFEILAGADSTTKLAEGGFVLHRKQGEPLLIQNILRDYAGFLQETASVYPPMSDCDINKMRRIVDYENENERRRKLAHRHDQIAAFVGLLMSLILFALWYSDLIILGE